MNRPRKGLPARIAALLAAMVGTGTPKLYMTGATSSHKLLPVHVQEEIKQAAAVKRARRAAKRNSTYAINNPALT